MASKVSVMPPANSEFSGQCVGGPRHGEFVIHRGPRIFMGGGFYMFEQTGGGTEGLWKWVG